MIKLTAKEEEVMEKIWQIGNCAPKDVLALYEEPKPHINTIATMFQMLEKKGYLTHEAKGRGYIYSPEASLDCCHDQRKPTKASRPPTPTSWAPGS